MDSQTASPAAPDRPDPSTATVHIAPMNKADRNEFSNAARDMIKFGVPTGAGQADCVSSEDVLEETQESSGPLQGTGTPAVQGHPTLPDDDCASVLATVSLTFPHELVERIILLVDTGSILKCRLVNREFNAIIQSSTLVQYYLACTAAGVIDNPRSPLSYAERFEALKKREGAWRKLKPVFEMTIPIVDYRASMLHRMTAGNYFLTYENRNDLYYCRLPSSPQDNPQWFRTPGLGPRQSWSGSIVGMGMAVYEHDLVVNVISSEIGNQAPEAGMQRHNLDLILLQFSTGQYHPLARHPLIHIQGSPSTKPYANVRIVGDHLALVVHDDDGSELSIFDWKTGHKRLKHKTTGNAYENSIPVFVSPELLLVPNRILSHFEVWQLFPSHLNSKPPVQILSLKIPIISNNYSIIHICCHGELSPFLHSMPYFPPRPFFPSPEDSIIIVNFLLESRPGLRTTYKLIMHRRALLDMIQKWTSPSLLKQQEGLKTWLTNEINVHPVADPDDGLVRLAAQSELVSTMLTSQRTRDSPTQTSATSPTSHISTDSIYIGSALSTSRYNILQVQWANWGPPISRWFRLNGTRLRWIPQSTGQRYVFLNPNPRDRKKCMVGVMDFDLHDVRRNARLRRGEGEDNGGIDSNGKRNKEGNEQLEILDHEGVFSEEVYMGLKCVVYHAPGEYDFDAVLMDEERLLGLKIDGWDRVESIKVLYFG